MQKKEIGIFGGSFNPIHSGHLNSLRKVQKTLGLSHIFIVPNNKNPLKESEEAVEAKHRLNMVRLAVRDDESFIVDDQEILKPGISYSIETIRYYKSRFGSENIHFIIGADCLSQLDKWKNFEEILKETNIVITTRPHSDLPYSENDFPEGVRPFIKSFGPAGVIKLKTGRKITCIQLEDIDISSTQIRKRLHLGRSVESFVNFEVEEYIKENNLYAPFKVKISDFEEFSRYCADVLFSKKAIKVRGFDLRKMQAPSEFIIICSGSSTKQTGALANAVLSRVKEDYGVLPLSVEGQGEGRWVLVDYGSLIVHIFYDFVRNEYRLEDLWKEGVDLNIIDRTLETK